MRENANSCYITFISHARPVKSFLVKWLVSLTSPAFCCRFELLVLGSVEVCGLGLFSGVQSLVENVSIDKTFS